VVFDFATNSFHFDTGGNCEEGRGRHCIRGQSRLVTTSADTERRLPFLQVSINDVVALALIDTGSANTRMNPELVALLERHTRLRPVMLPEQYRRATSERAIAIPTMRLGGTEIRQFGAAEERDLPLFRQADGSVIPGLIIGTEELRQFESISIDFSNPTQPVYEFVERQGNRQVAVR